MIRLETNSRNSYGSLDQVAVIKSMVFAERTTAVYSYVRSSPITPTDFTGNKTTNACETSSYKLCLYNSSIKTSSASCKIRTFSASTSPKIRIPNPGPGNG